MQFGKMLMDELTNLVKSNQMITLENEKLNKDWGTDKFWIINCCTPRDDTTN